MTTVSIGRDRSIREISVEVRDHGQAKTVAGKLAELDGVRVISFTTGRCMAHEGGKLMIEVRHPVKTLQDMRDIYTPGVARVCMAIADDPTLANRFTMIGRTVAICTNGTRVLGPRQHRRRRLDARDGGQGDLLPADGRASRRCRS